MKKHQRLLETLPKVNNELHTIKVELKNLKSLMEFELKNYSGNNSYLFVFLLN